MMVGRSLTWNLLSVLLTSCIYACWSASLCRDGMPFSRLHKDREQKGFTMVLCLQQEEYVDLGNKLAITPLGPRSTPAVLIP